MKKIFGGKRRISVLLCLVMLLTSVGGIFIGNAVVYADTESIYFLKTAQGNASGDSWANAKALDSSAFSSALASYTNVYIGSGTYSGSYTLSSSGNASKYKNVIGVDTGNGKPHFSKANNALSGTVFTVSSGVSYVNIDNFKVTGYQYAVNAKGSNQYLNISNIDAYYSMQSIYMKKHIKLQYPWL